MHGRRNADAQQREGGTPGLKFDIAYAKRGQFVEHARTGII